MSIFCYGTCTFSSTPEVHPDPKDTGYHLSIAPKKWETEGVDIEQQYFLGTFSRKIEWILNKIVAPLSWMEHQVFTSCSPEVKSGYLWNPKECPNCHFMKRWPIYCLLSPKQEIFQKYWPVEGFRHDFMILP